MVGSLEDIRCGGFVVEMTDEGPDLSTIPADLGKGEGLFAFSRVPESEWPELVHTDWDGVPDQIKLTYTYMLFSGVIIMTVPVNA